MSRLDQNRTAFRLAFFVVMLVVQASFLYSHTLDRYGQSLLKDPAVQYNKTKRLLALYNGTTIPRFGYTFIISGCSDTSCLGYILNVVAAARVLQDHQTVADIILKVQMHGSPHEQLPAQQEDWLRRAGVQLQYMNSKNGSSTSSVRSFGMAQLLKFRTLQMFEYDRVIFMDADILPLCSLDYLFHESYQPDGLLEENVVMEGFVAPANGGLFLVTPTPGEFDRIIGLVHEYRRTHNDTSNFDTLNGWGHPIHRNYTLDKWHSFAMRKDGYHWDYYGAHADQGLLHHWIRYMKMNHTQLKTQSIQTWADVTHDPNYSLEDFDKVIPVEVTTSGSGGEHNNSTRNNNITTNFATTKLLAKVKELRAGPLPSCGVPGKTRNPYFRDTRLPNPPFNNFVHYAGGQKPWNEPIRAEDIPMDRPTSVARGQPREVWLYYLGRANATFALHLNSTITVLRGNPFGYAPQARDLLDPKAELPKRRRRRRRY